ncbi:uncharacterized protein B0T15DRAFT_530788 [Chaetomium strumarium]|uniref:Uncharacterized protein n=1 Tax=Chaetomium strumarium TaxID=1170767 RepID=A0AAJ0GWZ2_9PEZI|nr:hypothetical protein B0T15DRAFT_530788 [Chaetomium strumarium]
MTVPRQSRFSETGQGRVNALLQAYTASAIEEEGNKKPFVALGTKAERDRIWDTWTEILRDVPWQLYLTPSIPEGDVFYKQLARWKAFRNWQKYNRDIQ